MIKEDDMRKLYIIVLCLLGMFFMISCSKKADNSGQGKEMEFTVVDDINIPDELKEIIDEKKNDAFQMTFTSGDNMYLVVGYGEQSTGGYSIKVENLCMKEDGIHLKTNLLGPDKEEKVSSKPSFPYVVVKIQTIDAEVTYE